MWKGFNRKKSYTGGTEFKFACLLFHRLYALKNSLWLLPDLSTLLLRSLQVEPCVPSSLGHRLPFSMSLFLLACWLCVVPSEGLSWPVDCFSELTFRMNNSQQTSLCYVFEEDSQVLLYNEMIFLCPTKLTEENPGAHVTPRLFWLLIQLEWHRSKSSSFACTGFVFIGLLLRILAVLLLLCKLDIWNMSMVGSWTNV